jgi:cell division protein FtsQ
MRRLITRKTLIWSTAGIALLGAAAAVKFMPVSPNVGEILADTDGIMLDLSAAAGMKLNALTVEGRKMTSREDLLAAIDVERGSPILSINVAEARAAIEALPWVKTAKVERRLPDTLHILIEERIPYALWQRDGRYTLVDRDGKSIVDVPAADQSLPLIVGQDAPAHAAALFEALGTETELAARVRSAVRVGERRWNIYLDSFEGGIAIRLPEGDVTGAWTRLAVLEREHKILERNIDFIDMRLEDRLVVRLQKDSSTAMPAEIKKAPVINASAKQGI